MSNSQYIILDALRDAFVRGNSEDDINYAYDNEPESNVFFAGGDWDEDDIASIRYVGDEDIQRKIDYWRKLVDKI